MWGLWTVGIGLVSISAWADDSELGLVGIAVVIVAASLTVLRDNHRTRRVVRACVRSEPPVRSLRG